MAEEKIGAFFDFDGTPYDGVVAFDFIKFLLAHGGGNGMNAYMKARGIALLPIMLFYFMLDKANLGERYALNRKVYGMTRGFSPNFLESNSRNFFGAHIERKFYPETLRILKGHRKMGHRVCIVTSALKEIVCPVKDYIEVDDILATELYSKDDAYTGHIKSIPIGKNRIRIIKSYCRLNHINLKKSYAYSDHHSDIPMLENVGTPIAVKPGNRLRNYAIAQGWEIIT